MIARARHLQDERLFDCYLAERSGEPLDPPVAEHLADCDACARALRGARAFMDRLRAEADAETDAVFTPDRLRAQQQQIARRLEHLGRPARVISFPGRLVRRTHQRVDARGRRPAGSPRRPPPGSSSASRSAPRISSTGAARRSAADSRRSCATPHPPAPRAWRRCRRRSSGPADVAADDDDVPVRSRDRARPAAHARTAGLRCAHAARQGDRRQTVVRIAIERRCR